jgi:hypothetical protein
MPSPQMTKEYAHTLFEYRDGKLYWKISRSTRDITGKEAGYINHGYRMVMIDGRNWRVHRIVFLMHHGFMPDMIDHINTDRSDNRIENLRAADEKTNSYNAGLRKDNVSGVKGVSWDKNRNKWVVRISLNRKINQWYVDCFDKACEIAKAARAELHGEYANHGVA